MDDDFQKRSSAYKTGNNVLRHERGSCQRDQKRNVDIWAELDVFSISYKTEGKKHYCVIACTELRIRNWCVDYTPVGRRPVGYDEQTISRHHVMSRKLRTGTKPTQ